MHFSKESVLTLSSYNTISACLTSQFCRTLRYLKQRQHKNDFILSKIIPFLELLRFSPHLLDNKQARKFQNWNIFWQNGVVLIFLYCLSSKYFERSGKSDDGWSWHVVSRENLSRRKKERKSSRKTCKGWRTLAIINPSPPSPFVDPSGWSLIKRGWVSQCQIYEKIKGNSIFLQYRSGQYHESKARTS